MKSFSILFIALFIFFPFLFADDDAEFHWPKEIEKKKFTTTLYQPQYDSFKNNMLEGRMALSVQEKDGELVFGALFFKARLATDLDDRTAVLEKLNIEKVMFPGYEDSAKIEQFKAILTEEIESWDVVMSLDRIAASLSEVEDLKELSVQLNNDPPDIYFRAEPAVLVTIDGDPILTEVQGADFEYVVNTPYFIVKEKNKYYIKGGKFWYVSGNVSSGYNNTKNVPADVEKFATDNLPEEDLDSISQSITEAPELIVVTKPSELVMTSGKPDYSTISGTTLLYVSNTSSDIVMDIETQNHYVLLAGRWYFSRSLDDGDWQFIEPDELPEEFAKIPEESDMGNVRSSVPGTPEAQDALLEQSIPQTATVDRTTTVEVEWDGDPKFKDVKGTEVKVAKNSDKTVLQIEDKYYCVDDAIWFVSDKPTGPWKVSDIRPDEVDELPPDSEAYNVKYVYVYESTSEVVYVGYLPGYNWSLVYGGTVVYGTGYWYQPWYGAIYYPRPVTWGFGVHWNPWTGWGFSFGVSYGWVGWRFHPRPMWWGPRGFHRGYRHGFNRGFHHGYRAGARAGFRAGYAAGSRNSNVYRNRSSGVRTTNANRGAQTGGNRNLDNKARPSTRPNNVYADRQGNVYQRDNNGNWENRNNDRTRDQQGGNQNRDRSNQGQKSGEGNKQNYDKQQNRQNKQSTSNNKQNYNTQSQNRQSSSRGNTQSKGSGYSGMSSSQKQSMNNSYQNRSRGTQNYNRSSSYNRSSGGASRSGGSRSGGGGRRR